MKPRQRVVVTSAAGAHEARGQLVRRQPAPHGDWWVVRFDGAGRLSVHESNLRPARHDRREG